MAKLVAFYAKNATRIGFVSGNKNGFKLVPAGIWTIIEDITDTSEIVGYASLAKAGVSVYADSFKSTPPFGAGKNGTLVGARVAKVVPFGVIAKGTQTVAVLDSYNDYAARSANALLETKEALKLTAFDVRKVDFTGVNFDGLKWDKVDFSGAKVYEVDFTALLASRVDFNKLDLHKLSFNKTEKVDLTFPIISGLEVIGTKSNGAVELTASTSASTITILGDGTTSTVIFNGDIVNGVYDGGVVVLSGGTSGGTISFSGRNTGDTITISSSDANLSGFELYNNVYLNGSIFGESETLNLFGYKSGNNLILSGTATGGTYSGGSVTLSGATTGETLSLIGTARGTSIYSEVLSAEGDNASSVALKFNKGDEIIGTKYENNTINFTSPITSGAFNGGTLLASGIFYSDAYLEANKIISYGLSFSGSVTGSGITNTTVVLEGLYSAGHITLSGAITSATSISRSVTTSGSKVAAVYPTDKVELTREFFSNIIGLRKNDFTKVDFTKLDYKLGNFTDVVTSVVGTELYDFDVFKEGASNIFYSTASYTKSLYEVIFTGVDFFGVDFKGVDITKLDTSKIESVKNIFRKADFSKVDFSKVDFSKVDFAGAIFGPAGTPKKLGVSYVFDLSKVDFSKLDFTNVDFSGLKFIS
jgi:uncharacterized protein YjbI with pentapeptide repeats